MNKILTIIILLITTTVFSQNKNNFSLNGQIIDKETKEVISYARIFNKNTKKGTISNIDGYFQIESQTELDTFEISFIGYKKLIDDYKSLQKLQPQYFLEPNSKELNSVVIKANHTDVLYKLIHECKNRKNNVSISAKTYFSVNNSVLNNKIELYEAYYNSQIEEYDITNFELKSGRIALQNFNNRNFISIENVKAIIYLPLYKHTDYFPNSPLIYSVYKMKTLFDIHLDEKIITENNDTIFVLNYYPKDSSKNYFHGKIWVNKNKKFIEKMNFKCYKTQSHPYEPLFDNNNKIDNIDLDITKTFSDVNSNIILNQINYNININYISRENSKNEQHYSIQSNAILHLYDYQQKFELPLCNIEKTFEDYNKLSAYTHNNFFWDNNNEIIMCDYKNENKQFFEDSASITSKKNYLNLDKREFLLLSNTFKHWSPKRIVYEKYNKSRIAVSETRFNPKLSKHKDGSRFICANPTEVYNEDYQIKIHLLVDVNRYKDSIDILTSTFFNPFDTYFNFDIEINKEMQCFINIYFDLYEIERIELKKELELSDKSEPTIVEIYNKHLKNIQQTIKKYKNNVIKGENFEEMKKWNKIVLEKLHIDNIKQFFPELSKF